MGLDRDERRQGVSIHAPVKRATLDRLTAETTVRMFRSTPP